LAQQLGLNTCWVGGTFTKNKAVQVDKGEKFVAVISIGYGLTQGKAHVDKPLGQIAAIAFTPEWFKKGVMCAMLAPSAMNKQNFQFEYMADGKVVAAAKNVPFSSVDLGIAKLHFEIGSGKDSTIWK
jgi:nitroreductase